MGGVGRSIGLAAVVLAASLSGCVGFAGDAGVSCSASFPYAERLVFEQDDLYEQLGEAMDEANRSSEATWARQPQPAWMGARGTVETVRADGVVHGFYEATPSDNASLRVTDSSLAAYGSLWLDSAEWVLPGSDRAQIQFVAPNEGTEIPGVSENDPHETYVTFVRSNLTQREAAERVERFHGTFLPTSEYDPLDDPDFGHAWNASHVRVPSKAVRADAAVAEVVDAGEVLHRQAPFEGDGFPHTLGTVILAGEDLDGFDGRLELRFGHDVRALAATDTEPGIVLEVTTADRAHLSTLGSETIGRESLEQTAEDRLGSVDGIPGLALADATYQDGGERAVETSGPCNGMKALGEPLDDAERL